MVHFDQIKPHSSDIRLDNVEDNPCTQKKPSPLSSVSEQIASLMIHDDDDDDDDDDVPYEDNCGNGFLLMAHNLKSTLPVLIFIQLDLRLIKTNAYKISKNTITLLDCYDLEMFSL